MPLTLRKRLEKTSMNAHTCLMQILYATGMRITEMMSLPASAVRGKPDMILIRGKGSKERLVPLSPDAKTAIETWLFHRDKKEDERTSKGMTGSKFLFPSSGKLGHLTRHWFFQKIKQWARGWIERRAYFSSPYDMPLQAISWQMEQI